MGPGDWPEPKEPSPSSCCVLALCFSPSCPTSTSWFIFFIFLMFFFLKMLPLLICSGSVAKFSVERRRGDELELLRRPTCGAGAGGPRLRRAARSLGCPRLPGDSEKFSSHLKCAVSGLYKPSARLRRFYFLFCHTFCLYQGKEKLCLRWDAKSGKKNPSLLLFGS